jgi:hypothetical protein
LCACGNKIKEKRWREGEREREREREGEREREREIERESGRKRAHLGGHNFDISDIASQFYHRLHLRNSRLDKLIN